MRKYIFLLIGFISGSLYMIACSGSGQTGIQSSIAATLGNAIDVIFDNSESGLSSSNLQDAIEELNTKIVTLEKQFQPGSELAAIITGTWSGTYSNEGNSTDISLTLNSDGSLSCENSGGSAFSGACDDDEVTWTVLTRVIRIDFNDGSEDRTKFYYPTFADSSILELSDGVQHLYSLSKAED
jgi:hypothetical protein